MSDDVDDRPLNPNREWPSLDNIERLPTLRGWDPSRVPMPRRRKLADPSPFLLMGREHQKLYAKMHPLQQFFGMKAEASFGRPLSPRAG